jgi:cell division protein FtsX
LCGDKKMVAATESRRDIKRIVRIVITILIAVVGFFAVMLINDLKAATDKKVDKEVYAADKMAQQETNNRVDEKLNDIVDLLIDPQVARKRVIKKRNKADWGESQ